MNLDVLSNLAQIASVAIALVASFYGIWRKIDIKQERLEVSTARLESKLEGIEQQFGPNGGGLREAVNTMSRNVLKIEDRVTKIGDDVARLSGEFHQHTLEKNN
jgi:hypothetical protein